MMDKDAFLRELLLNYYEHECLEIGGEDVHDLLLKHGFTVERPATAEECESDWAQDYGLNPGDVTAFQTQELKEFLHAPAPKGE